MPDEEIYSNIRSILGDLIGKRLVEITQQDEKEFKDSGAAYVALHFDDGSTLKFHIDEGDGFEYNGGTWDNDGSGDSGVSD